MWIVPEVVRQPASSRPGPFLTGDRAVAGRVSVRWPLAKRGLDIVIALVMLLVLLPVVLVIAALIKIDSRGPVLFRQMRCGRGAERFVVLKFRTMVAGASPVAHQQYIAALAADEAPATGGLRKLNADARVTRFGALLRKSSLDELPQLLNVLIGQMSIVGPRPAIEYELEHYRPEDHLRFAVRPGLTGLWQVSGRSNLGFRDMLALDAEYARTTSPGLDARILIKTPIAVFKGQSA